MTHHDPHRRFRPKVLLRAARFGLAQYNRTKELGRLIKSKRLPKEGKAYDALLTREICIEDARKTGAASYDIQEHISVLTALLAEMRYLKHKH